MNKEVKYGGYTAVPSDYECPDGDLALSLNLINENGALAPVQSPICIHNFADNSPVYIHQTATERIIILRNSRPTGSTIAYSLYDNMSDCSNLIDYDSNVEINQFSSIGNILLILTNSGIDYFNWDADTHKYNPLGNAIPNIEISFGLQGKTEMEPSNPNEYYSTNINSVLVADMYKEWVEETQRVITDAVMAKVNKFIADHATNKGRFIFPFFVRYALRLYDGSLINHSSPVLMNAASGEAPNILALSLDKQDGGDNHYEKMRFRVAAICHSLDYQVISSDEALSILRSSWADIVKSVDLFISAPIYTFDPDGKCKIFIEDDVDSFTSICKAVDAFDGKTENYKCYKAFDLYRNVFYKDIHDDLKPHFNRRCQLPLLPSGTSLVQKIKNNSLFYLLKSIKIEDLTTQRTIVDVPDDYLGSLVNREVMTDDYDSHDLHIASVAYNYNNRLNIANVTRRIFPGFSPKSSLCLNDASTFTYRIIYFIKENGRTLKAEIPYSVFGEFDHNLFLYHPNPNVYRVVIYRRSPATKMMLDCPMQQHDFLAGSFSFNETDSLPWKQISIADPEIAASTRSELLIHTPNKIYTSEVNNPFYFPVTGIVTVGSGEIRALSTAAKALSQGQFGQYPLYAFTTEGVWALEVSSTGSYSARQPITRDVCRNTDGITQLDSAVLFPTDRGLLIISGSQIRCISDLINCNYPFDIRRLPQFSHLHLQIGHDDDNCLPTLPFSDFMMHCRMIYDYVHQRVIVYSPDVSYAYVFSLKSNLWGMMFSTVQSHLNSYPEALAVDADNNLVNFSDRSNISVNTLFVTRPLKLDAADILKAVDTVIQRGNFHKGHVQSVLYGSRDLHSWHLIWSSKDHYLRGFRGSPYKYFRIAVIATLNADESIYGASVQFTPRLTNQPR